MISYKGKVNLAVALPLVAQIAATFDLSGLAGEIAALGSMVLTFTPPSVVGIGAILASIAAALQLGVAPPTFDLKGDLVIKLGLLQAKYDLYLKVANLLVSGSLRLYEYEGKAGNFGPELSDLLAGPEVNGGLPPTRSTFAVLLVAESGTSGETTLKILRGA